MTAKGVGPLVFYDGRMNGQTYINIIKSQLLPYIKQNFKENDTWYYVQDNTPCRKSAFTINWFKKIEINILDWPATSPDLNLIENLWDIIDKKLTNYHPRTVNDLQQIILKLWSGISIETYQKLVQSMPRRVETCIRVKGNTSSKY